MIRLALFILLLPAVANSQAPFELENRKALKLTDSRLKLLLNKEWHVEKIEDDVRGDVRETTFSNISGIKYNSDGSYNHGFWRSGGTWTILEGRYIKHQTERKEEIKSNFGGTYAITFLGDSTLVLTKLLTSSQDMKRVIHLTTKRPWMKKVTNPYFKSGLYYSKLSSHQIDSISRLSSESLFEYNFKFTKDSVFFPTLDSLYKIKRKFRN